MSDKQTGPPQVRPNALRDQRTPNTFRNQAGRSPVGKTDLNSGGGNAAPPRGLARPRLPSMWLVVLIVLAVFFALAVLNGAR